MDTPGDQEDFVVHVYVFAYTFNKGVHIYRYIVNIAFWNLSTEPAKPEVKNFHFVEAGGEQSRRRRASVTDDSLKYSSADQKRFTFMRSSRPFSIFVYTQ